MRVTGPAAIAIVLAATGATATAQPTGASGQPVAAATDPPADPTPTAAYYPPQAYPAPAAEPPRPRSWFGTVGLGGMGYVGREYTPYDNGDKGSGVLLEAVAGKWMRDDAAFGVRIEAHTDDAENYTDSSITAVARFAVTESRRFYLEPGIGLGFHKDESSDDTESGFAATITGGYQLTRKRFACDLRFGGAHYRFDEDVMTHGLLWVGVAIGFQ